MYYRNTKDQPIISSLIINKHSNNIFYTALMTSFLQGSTEPKQQKHSKSRLDFQLPRIAKGEFNQQLGPIALRFHWLTLPKDYSAISHQQIEAQYTQLRRDLVLLNEQAVRSVERISIKPGKNSKKTIDSNKLGELNEKQGENNTAIIARLRIQLQQLQKRILNIGQTGKEHIEQEIQEAKEQISYLRHKNKDIQQKSKFIGNNIENGDEVFNQIKKLQIDLNIADKKKAKLEQRSSEVSQNLQKVKKKLNELTGEAEQAQTFIQQDIQLSRVGKEEKKVEFLFRQRTYNLEILKKNEQSFQNVKQQKYHQYLKQLQDLTSKIKQIETSINNSEEKHINQRAEILDYQYKLKMAIEAQKEKKNYSVLGGQNLVHEKQNNETKKATIQSLGKNKSLVSKIKRSDSSQKKAQQQPKKLRLLNMRPQKQTKKEANDKMNHTISAISNKNMAKKQMTNKTFDQSNLSYQQATPKINSKDFLQTINKESQKFTQQFNPSQNIEEDIELSLDHIQKPKEQHKEKQPDITKDNSKKQAVNKTLNQKVGPAEGDRVIQKNMEEDQDIADFKKSIEAELNQPFAGLKNVDITLVEIQQSIRQQQTKSRLNRYSQKKPIEEEQESIGQ